MLFSSIAYLPESWDSFAWFRLYRVWSSDARSWTIDANPLISPDNVDETAYIAWSPSLFTWQGKQYLTFHMDWQDAVPGGVISDIYAVQIDAAMHPIGQAQLLCSRHLFGDKIIRVADPFFYVRTTNCTSSPPLGRVCSRALA